LKNKNKNNEFLMKKIIKFPLWLLFIITLPYCQAAWHPYLGIGAGLSKSQNALSVDFRDPNASQTPAVNMDTTGLNGTILAGVHNQQQHFFFGTEIFASLHNFKNKRKSEITTLVILGPYANLEFEASMKSTNGISFMIGKDLTSFADVFLKLDLLGSQFRIKYANIRTSGKGEKSKWLLGYAPGVGIQFHLTKSILTRFDYSYRIYNEFHTQNIAHEPIAQSTTISGRIAPRIHQFALSLIYRF
jgi:opacity protein-like surface antigen